LCAKWTVLFAVAALLAAMLGRLGWVNWPAVFLVAGVLPLVLLHAILVVLVLPIVLFVFLVRVIAGP